MAASIPNSPHPDSRSFRKIVDAFLGGEGLPFAEVLSAERIERVFQKHGCAFGLHGIYTTAIMVWSFRSQVLRDGKEASCQAAVARVVSYCQMQGLQSPTQDTGDYCRARAKLSLNALHDLSREVAEERDWRISIASIDARFTITRGHRNHGPILLFVHDDRSSAGLGHADLCTQASSEA